MKKIEVVDAIFGIIGAICAIGGIATGIKMNSDLDSKLENEYGLKKIEEKESE